MPQNTKRGRPKVTDKPDVVSLLVSAFRDGLTIRQACIQSGISHDAERWLELATELITCVVNIGSTFERAND